MNIDVVKIDLNNEFSKYIGSEINNILLNDIINLSDKYFKFKRIKFLIHKNRIIKNRNLKIRMILSNEKNKQI